MTDKNDHPNHTASSFWKCWLLVGYSRVDSGDIHLIHVMISLIQNLGNVKCTIHNASMCDLLADENDIYC